MNKFFSLLLLLTISCATQKQDVAIITGKLVGSDGNPILNAHIAFVPADQVKPISSTVNDDGTYQLVADHIGYISIEYSGTNHLSKKVPLLVAGPETITINVQLSADAQSAAHIQFTDSSSISAKYYAITTWLNKYKQNDTMDSLGEELFRKIDGEQDVDRRALLCFSYMSTFFNTPNVDRVKAKKILQIMSPASIAWDISPNYLMWFYFILPAEDHALLNDYIERVSHENAYPRVRAEAIAYFLSLAEMKKDALEIKENYQRLIAECPGTFRAEDARFKYEILAPGKKVPSFAVTSLDNPGETYTDRTMLGKVYLIEFWATSCGHCRGEMPFLHDAYEKYRDKGFEILSLSLDRSADEVIEYRNGEWKMPWHHAFLEGEFEHEIARKFGVKGYPTPILVDAEGRIIATGNALRDVTLIETLSEYFEK